MPEPASRPLAPYASVLAATDFSPCSLVALREAARIAAWSDAKVAAVHVVDTAVVIEIEAALSPLQESISTAMVRDAEQAWAGFSADLTGPGGRPFPLHVSINNRLVGILRAAREHKADLLVLGAAGDHGADVGIGSVARACVRKSMTDVLVVRDSRSGSPGSPFRCIVAAVDFSATSLCALQRAAQYAARDGSMLHVLHVFSAPWHGVHYRSPTPLAQPHQQQQYRDSLQRRLRDFAAHVLSAHPGLRSSLTVFDHAGHRSGIVEFACSVSADLIVLGTRGRTNLRDVLLGSTAEKALRDTLCSVLAVKPEGFTHPLAASDDAQPQSARLLS
ncbi:MAG: universal stress protein [Phycisphaerales bacterium]|nr:universal stress protein [Phycisphaerales bacterium]